MCRHCQRSPLFACQQFVAWSFSRLGSLFLTSRSGIIHGDIKPDNLLVFETDSDGVNIRLADFGFSSLFAGKIAITGTHGWMAPEWHHRRFTTDVVGAK